MKSLFSAIITIALIVPAYAFDTSNCETIGHMGQTTTTDNCFMRSDCVALHTARCKAQGKTADECDAMIADRCANASETSADCEKKIAERNEKAAEILLMRCDATSALLSKKQSATGMTLFGEFVTDDGASIDLKPLSNDKQNIYIIYKPVGAEFWLSDFAVESYSIIGTPDDDGVKVGILEKQ